MRASACTPTLARRFAGFVQYAHEVRQYNLLSLDDTDRPRGHFSRDLAKCFLELFFQLFPIFLPFAEELSQGSRPVKDHEEGVYFTCQQALYMLDITVIVAR